MMRACLTVIVAFVVIYVIYFAFLFNLFSPGNFIFPIFLTLLMLFSLVILRNGIEKLPELRLMRGNSDKRKDGELTAVFGRILPTDEAIFAPHSSTRCVFYGWEIWRWGKNINSSRSSRKIVAGGSMMIPCYLRSESAGDVKLLGFPNLEGFSQTEIKALPLSERMQNHLAGVPLEADVLTGLINTQAFANGECHKEYRTIEPSDLSTDDSLAEQCLPVGEEITAIGYWSDADRSLRQGEARGTRGPGLWIHKGRTEAASSKLQRRIALQLVGGALLAIAVNVAVWLLSNLANEMAQL